MLRDEVPNMTPNFYFKVLKNSFAEAKCLFNSSLLKGLLCTWHWNWSLFHFLLYIWTDFDAGSRFLLPVSGQVEKINIKEQWHLFVRKMRVSDWWDPWLQVWATVPYREMFFSCLACYLWCSSNYTVSMHAARCWCDRDWCWWFSSGGNFCCWRTRNWVLPPAFSQRLQMNQVFTLNAFLLL